MRRRNSERSASLAIKLNGRISVEVLFVVFKVSVTASVLFEKPSNPKGAAAQVSAAALQNLRLVREGSLMRPGIQAPKA
jgi:hypothetical protein